LSLGWGTAEAQSVWDRPQQQQVPYQHRTAEYRVEEPIPADVWGDTRSAWTAVDSQGRTVNRAPAVATQTVTQPARPVATQQPQQRQAFVPLSESIIRSSLQSSIAPPVTARDLLQGMSPQVVEPPTAAGYARLVGPASGFGGESTWGAVDISRPVERYAPPPQQVIEPAASQAHIVAEERAYPLFDIPAGSADSLFGARTAHDATWRTALAEAAAATPAGDGLRIPVEPMPGATGGDTPEATAYQDGLDAIYGVPKTDRSPYEPVPLQQIKPYRSYTPEGIDLCPSPDARCPEIKEMPGSLGAPDRVLAHMDFLWVPSNVFYSPLYFEDPALERYGHTHGPLLQPFASTTRFGIQLIGLPYQIALDPPHRRVYPLGFFRPGECAPKQVPNVPLNAKAAAASGAVYTGLIFAFP
jgi:hypothetical protein